MTDRESTRPAMIQIVDDDPAMRLLTRATLEQAGFSVIESADGSEGVSLFRKMRPDLVLLDVIMPQMDGFNVCRLLRKLPEGKEIPIIMLTGMDDVESVRKAFDAGATDFIGKPINWLLLRYRVMHMLRSARLCEDLRVSQARISLAQRIAHLGHWHFNFKTKDFVCSDAVLSLLDRRDDISVHNPESLLRNIHPDDKPRVQAALENAIGNRQPYQENYRINVQGEERRINSQGEIQTNGNGEPEAITGIIQDVTDIYHAEQKIFRLAHFDALTGLAKRKFFMEKLAEAVFLTEHGHGQLAVMILDLDRFKRINENLGHVPGDQILRKMAKRIQRSLQQCHVLYPSSLTEDHCIARFGGNEFAILLPEVQDTHQVNRIAGHLLKDIAQPFTFDNCEVLITTSIGICLFPEGSDDQQDIIRNADIALRQAKSQGRDTFRLYHPSMGKPTQDRLILENDLRNALKNDEFVLYFQPQVDIRSGQLLGAETLIRWQHPQQGLKLPGAFLPLALESGLIIEIDQWVLRQACAQIARWQAAGYDKLRLSVNVSGQLFAQEGVAALISDIVRQSGIPTGALEIELTENTLMQNNAQTISTLTDLKQLGTNIAIDDFGTGYSSLSYLKNFPIDTLKIDRSFIRDLENAPGDIAITRTIIALGENLGLTTICEGIETHQQKDLLVDLGCYIGQGYLFARPENLEAFSLRLAQQKNRNRVGPAVSENQNDSSQSEQEFMHYNLGQ
ncbi:response receiver sensor diguanylate cyclase/phosphodiesterase, PAS domain-containing [Syntrophotalea carbinolica DSM 2380]|uniref:Response receiver sensor diguanylate cyclase/phosphodiesterase, PAS domain-containing n=1 Tax=Syntrophotalea carbinolica (strain DSM 2380 / NBRC 103641 / GraBd1) TaxID=338963 RepID=Q3A5Q2_SYNC1|nr:EAL domain-containing protein [Syntrophotalea carbinolica]ABA88305.1 response receiver sensor diguanylate cyclase/phosphodiesterase, PAS domain-containing [Syntrophotalea carbinolica DSM 2380]